MPKNHEKQSMKKFATIEEQIEILQSRNLTIKNYKEAEQLLQRISYYRLSGYMLAMKSPQTGKFQKGKTLHTLINLYEFDRKLRHLLIGIIEQIEIALRNQISYEFSFKYGPNGYMDSNNFKNKQNHQKFLDELSKNQFRSKELFAIHHQKKYEGMPLWVATELFSFGMISQFYKNMLAEEKKLIAKKYYSTSQVYLGNWLHVLTFIRNACAHYARIYNKKIPIPVKLFKRLSSFRNDKLLAVLYIIKELSPEKEIWNQFLIRFMALMESYDDVIDNHHIGFTKGWEDILK